MFSEKQCNIARLMTGADTPDEIISEEHAAMLGPNRNVAAMRIDQALSLYGKPFNQVWELALKDFREIASQYNISPATLFCVYLEWLDMIGKSLS